MGYTSTHREPGEKDLDWFRREFGLNDPEKNGELLDGATCRNVFYGAWRLGESHGDEAGQVIALVVLIQRTRSDSTTDNGWFNFTYKDLTDSMGPCEDRCPARILAMLTPTTNEYANAWRDRCRANLAARATRPKVSGGDVVRFATPMEFSNGDKLDTFVYTGKGSRFRSYPGGYCHYRITSWRDLKYEVVGKAS